MKSSTQDKIAGTSKAIAGSVKATAGKLVGNDRLQAKGMVKKTEGRTQTKRGEFKQVLGK